MSSRGLASAGAAGAWAVAAGEGEGDGVGSGPGRASSDPARAEGLAPSASAAASSQPSPGRPANVCFMVITASSLSTSLRLPDIRLLPRPHAAPGLVEEALVVALPHLLAGLRRQPREERRIHVVDLQVLRLLGEDHHVGPKNETVRVTVDDYRG